MRFFFFDFTNFKALKFKSGLRYVILCYMDHGLSRMCFAEVVSQRERERKKKKKCALQSIEQGAPRGNNALPWPMSRHIAFIPVIRS